MQSVHTHTPPLILSIIIQVRYSKFTGPETFESPITVVSTEIYECLPLYLFK